MMTNINRNQRDRYFKKVKGNRSIHAVMSTDGGCTLSSRSLSCYCDPCLECNYEACENSNYVSGWEEQDLERQEGHHRTAVTRSDVSTTIEVIKDLAAKHAIVAIASADRGEDYYLLQVTSDGPEVLEVEAISGGLHILQVLRLYVDGFLLGTHEESHLTNTRKTCRSKRSCTLQPSGISAQS